MNMISGGYYIVTPVARADYMNKMILPDTILSVSECICDVHPKITVLWSNSNEANSKYAQQLNISQDVYKEMDEWVTKNLEKGILGFPQVFATVDLARQFIAKFLCHLSNAKIIGIGLTEEHLDNFLKYEELHKIEEEHYFIENLLLHRNSIEEKNSKLLGYEVIGFDHGTFHSYLCNGLENDFNEHFKLTLNPNGLIPSIKDAARYCEYSNNEDLETETVLWLPWAIFEYN